LKTVSQLAEESILSTSHVKNRVLQTNELSQSFVLRKETGAFSVKDINIAKNIKIPTVYWFANINNNCEHVEIMIYQIF